MRDRAGGNSSQAGYSLIEAVLVLALAAFILGMSSVAWLNYKRKVTAISTAQVASGMIQQARLLSIYRNITHFVVFDPDNRTLEIYADSSAPLSSFDTGDTRVSRIRWPESVDLSLPTQPSPLSNPLATGNLSDAWFMPLPDSSAAWGSALRGVLTTPSGLIRSGESTPATISQGVVVFTDSSAGTVAIGVHGRAGTVRSFRLEGSAWTEM